MAESRLLKILKERGSYFWIFNRKRNMKTYYTEYPTTEFKMDSDEKALKHTGALVVYRESDTEDGTPFVMLREDIKK